MRPTKLNRALCAMMALLIFAANHVMCQTNGWGDGVNLQPSYFNSGNVNLGWTLMNQQSKIKTVRLEIEPQNGDGDGAPTIATVQRWISEANANGKNVICTYHNWQHNGSDDLNALNAAANWWRTNYAALRQAGPFTVNLMNEWGSHSQTPSTFASAYNNAISVVRQVYSGPIIVDIPGWAQETQVAYEARNLITDNNIVYSVHIYGSAYVQYGPARYMTTADLDVLGNSGRPVIVGEFGSLQSGGADWSALVDHARSKGWTLIGWAWNGDGTGMNMITPYWGDNPSATTFTTSSYFPDVYNKLRSGTTTMLTVSTTSLSFTASASTQNFSISSNTTWNATANQSWLTVSPASGSNNATVNVSVQANSGTANRSATITVTGGGITRTIAVTQSAGSTTPNLALNKPVTISSTDGYAGGGAQAVDGNPITRWASAWTDPQWIYVDLQATYSINRVVLNWENAYGRSYQLQVSSDATSWTSIYSTTSGDGGIDDLTVTGSGRYLRMYGSARATSYGYSLWELEVYGTTGTASNLTVSPSNLTLPSASSSGSISVTSNVSWNVGDNQTWLSVSPGSGSNNGTVTVSATANTATTSRTGTVTITGGGVTRTIAVTQIGATANPNIALNKATTASSTESATYSSANAVDGNTSTRWASALNPSTAQWVRVDFGTTQNIGRVRIVWEAAYATSYQIQTSNDGSAWTTIKSITGNSTLTNDHTGLSGSGRYLRIYCTARVNASWGYSIMELEAYNASTARMVRSLPDLAMLEESADLTAFPNPVENTVSILVDERHQINGMITLYNQFGSTVSSELVHGKVHLFDLSTMPAGLYLVQVESPEGKAIIKLLRK